MRHQAFVVCTNQKVENFPVGLHDAISDATKGIFGIPMRPPQVRVAEQTAKFRRLLDHQELVRSLIAKISFIGAAK